MNRAISVGACGSRRVPESQALLLALALMSAPLLAQSVPVAKSDTETTKKAKTVEPTVTTAPAAAGDDSKEETLTLSPFEVRSEKNGYFSSNTMSGTRLNSKIEDLGQSITVMTKEQMADFGALNINDVFDLMASTEGTGSYSSIVVDRTGAVTDNINLDPNNANRVRGIGSANIAFGNIAVTGRIPVDPLWLDSLELSRGPNANIFGLGNSSGTVNQVPANANLTRHFTKVELRTDSYGGWRTSLDVNRMLIRNKLGIRASYANQHTGFVRKPSAEDVRRLSLQVKIRPFHYTTLSLAAFSFKDGAQRPNYTTPRDYITSWMAAGKPSWNPVTRLITLNGVTYGQGMVAGSTTPITTLPSYFSSTIDDGRSMFRIGAAGEAPYWGMPTVTTSTTTPLTGGVSSGIRFVETTAVKTYTNTQPLFATTNAVSDKSLYDWDHINLMANNKQWDNDAIYFAQLDQIILNSPKHNLVAQATYMREDSKQLQNLPLGPASVNGVVGELRADANIVNLDGSANPYYGRPYVRSKEPFLLSKPMLWDTARAQLAYRLDFTHDKGWSRWLGVQQMLGYYEYKNQQSRQYAWRHTAVNSSEQWLKDLQTAGIPLANRTATGTQYSASNNLTRVYEQYYVGSTPGGGVEYAPSFFPEGASVPLVWGNTGAFHYNPTTITWTPSPDASSYTSSKETRVKTEGGVLQSSWLKDSLVTTVGMREDRVLDRNAVMAKLTADLSAFDFAASDPWQNTWRSAKGKTKTLSVVVRPFQHIPLLARNAQQGSGLGQFFAEMISSFSPTYNKSDNFVPQGPAYDLFMRPLPNQTGSSKDIGFWMHLFHSKLSIHYTHFETDQINLRNGDINTIAQRVLRIDGLNAADAWNLQDRATDWVKALNPTWSDAQVNAQVATTMGLSQETIDGLQNAMTAGLIAATQDYVSRGDELELFGNLSRNWTFTASVTKTEALNKNAGSTIEDWIKLRMPIWTTVEDPRFPDASRPGHNLLWWNIYGSAYTAYGYNSSNSAATNYATNVQAPLSVYRQLEGRPLPQMGRYAAKFSTKYNLAGLTSASILRDISVGGSLRWNAKKAIGFYGVESLPNTITALDPNKPIYQPAQTFADLFISYRRKMFKDRVRATFQLNVKNLSEKGGGLLATSALPDGTPLAYRIRDARQFVLSASFDL